MNRMGTVLKMHFLDARISLSIFWGILIGVYLFSVGLVYMFAPTEGRIEFGAIFAFYIFFIVLGIMTVKQTFSYILGMSVTRRDYYIATSLFFVVIAALSSLIYGIMNQFESNFFTFDDFPVNFFIMVGSEDYSFLISLWINFVIPLFLLCFFHTVSCLVYRFGKLALFGTMTAILLIFVLFTRLGAPVWLTDLLPSTFLGFTGFLNVLTFVFLLIGWSIMRKASVKSASG